jgi:hypothetical protein
MTRARTSLRPTRRRKTKPLMPAIAHAPEQERAALAHLAAIFRDHPDEASAASTTLTPGWFELDGAALVIDAMQAAAGVNQPTAAAIQTWIRHEVEKGGCSYEDSPEYAILVEAWGAKTGPLEDLRWGLDQARGAVETAYNARQEAAKAMKTLESLGLTIPTATPTPTVIARPLRGVPIIKVEGANRAEVIDQAEGYLANEFFMKDGRLVTVADAASGPTITAATKERVNDRLERVASFVQPARDDDGRIVHVPIPCPSWLPPLIVGKQVWPSIRELRGIMRGPYLRPDGTIGGTSAGYDPATALLTITDTDWRAVKDDPTEADVQEAVAVLLDVVKDFPFEAGSEDVGRAVWLAALLTLVGRPAFDGPAPLFLFDATTAGSGKTTLAKLISVIARGIDPPLAGMPDTTPELDKTITASLLRGDAMHVFDNVTTMIGNDVLDRLLTTTNWQGRRLGTNETIVAEARMLLVATSNNAGLRADTARRTLTLRLRPLTDHPEEQHFDRDPIVFAAQHRAQLLPAALTILRWHHLQADHPLPAVRPLGSFTAWSDAIRMAVIRAGLPDPVESQAMVRRIDDDTRLKSALLEAWEDWRPGFKGSARALIAKLFQTESDKTFTDPSAEADTMRAVVSELLNCTTAKPGAQEVRRLGMVIRGMRGRLFSGRCLDSDGHGKEGNVWSLRTTAARTPDDIEVVFSDAPEMANWGQW